jgi:hypothetical protein
MRRVARRVVVFTNDASDPDRFWLNRDCLPEHNDLWAGGPNATATSSISTQQSLTVACLSPDPAHICRVADMVMNLAIRMPAPGSGVQ